MLEMASPTNQQVAQSPAPKATETSQSPRLAVDRLTFEAGGRRLIDRASFALSSPALTVIMGSNGAGKSLMLRLLHGLIRPTAGTILWHGSPLDNEIRSRQAMVFQRPVLLRRSVADNIDFVLRLTGPGDPARRDDILAHVGLLERSRQPARLLSGGEQQRLALARALVRRPEVLFLDEPTANLDPAATQMIEEIVMAAHNQGSKVILVTHDVGQARRLAGEIVFMQQGTIAEQTTAATFFTNPGTEAARAYLDGRIFLSTAPSTMELPR